MLVNNLKYFFNKTLFVIYIYIYITFTWAYFDEGEKSQRWATIDNKNETENKYAKHSVANDIK